MTKRYNKAMTAKELAQVSDEEIDTSDIPELDGAFWANAKLNPPKTKPNVNLRLSEDVVDFFKGDNPKGYTSRMAAVLTAYAEAQAQQHK